MYEFKTLEKFTTVNDADLYHRTYITVHINHQPAGFVKIIYIGDEIAQKKLRNCTQFFIYKINNDNTAIANAYENNDLEFLCKKFKSFTKLTNDLEKDWNNIQKSINEDYGNKYIEFLDYWVNKPSRELIYVLDEKDKQFSIIQDNEELIVPVFPQNWKGQGIGKALAEKSINYAHNLRLHLWQSSNQTEQGKKLWKFATPGIEFLNSISKTPYFKNKRLYASVR